jgi:Family of unknown function (DUF6086)
MSSTFLLNDRGVWDPAEPTARLFAAIADELAEKFGVAHGFFYGPPDFITVDWRDFVPFVSELLNRTLESTEFVFESVEAFLVICLTMLDRSVLSVNHSPAEWHLIVKALTSPDRQIRGFHLPNERLNQLTLRINQNMPMLL